MYIEIFIPLFDRNRHVLLKLEGKPIFRDSIETDRLALEKLNDLSYYD